MIRRDEVKGSRLQKKRKEEKKRKTLALFNGHYRGDSRNCKYIPDESSTGIIPASRVSLRSNYNSCGVQVAPI